MERYHLLNIFCGTLLSLFIISCSKEKVEKTVAGTNILCEYSGDPNAVFFLKFSADGKELNSVKDFLKIKINQREIINKVTLAGCVTIPKSEADGFLEVVSREGNFYFKRQLNLDDSPGEKKIILEKFDNLSKKIEPVQEIIKNQCLYFQENYRESFQSESLLSKVKDKIEDQLRGVSVKYKLESKKNNSWAKEQTLSLSVVDPLGNIITSSKIEECTKKLNLSIPKFLSINTFPVKGKNVLNLRSKPLKEIYLVTKNHFKTDLKVNCRRDSFTIDSPPSNDKKEIHYFRVSILNTLTCKDPTFTLKDETGKESSLKINYQSDQDGHGTHSLNIDGDISKVKISPDGLYYGILSKRESILKLEIFKFNDRSKVFEHQQEDIDDFEFHKYRLGVNIKSGASSLNHSFDKNGLWEKRTRDFTLVPGGRIGYQLKDKKLRIYDFKTSTEKSLTLEVENLTQFRFLGQDIALFKTIGRHLGTELINLKEAKKLKTFSGGKQPENIKLSPDGKFLSYDLVEYEIIDGPDGVERKVEDMDFFFLDLSNNEERRVLFKSQDSRTREIHGFEFLNNEEVVILPLKFDMETMFFKREYFSITSRGKDLNPIKDFAINSSGMFLLSKKNINLYNQGSKNLRNIYKFPLQLNAYQFAPTKDALILNFKNDQEKELYPGIFDLIDENFLPLDPKVKLTSQGSKFFNTSDAYYYFDLKNKKLFSLKKKKQGILIPLKKRRWPHSLALWEIDLNREDDNPYFTITPDERFVWGDGRGGKDVYNFPSFNPLNSFEKVSFFKAIDLKEGRYIINSNQKVFLFNIEKNEIKEFKDLENFQIKRMIQDQDQKVILYLGKENRSPNGRSSSTFNQKGRIEKRVVLDWQKQAILSDISFPPILYQSALFSKTRVIYSPFQQGRDRVKVKSLTFGENRVKEKELKDLRVITFPKANSGLLLKADGKNASLLLPDGKEYSLPPKNLYINNFVYLGGNYYLTLEQEKNLLGYEPRGKDRTLLHYLRIHDIKNKKSYDWLTMNPQKDKEFAIKKSFRSVEPFGSFKGILLNLSIWPSKKMIRLNRGKKKEVFLLGEKIKKYSFCENSNSEYCNILPINEEKYLFRDTQKNNPIEFLNNITLWKNGKVLNSFRSVGNVKVSKDGSMFAFDRLTDEAPNYYRSHIGISKQYREGKVIDSTTKYLYSDEMDPTFREISPSGNFLLYYSDGGRLRVKKINLLKNRFELTPFKD